MHQTPSEIIFSLAPFVGDKINQPCVFRYDHGALKLRAPRKKGRPKGSTKKKKNATEEVENNFDFINVSNQPNHVDPESRLKIRRRVMVNHMRLKRRRARQLDHKSCVLVPQITSVDPFDAFPFQLEPYMHDLLKYYITTGWKIFYSIESHSNFNPMTDFWMPLAFQDDAFLHTLLGCADSHFADAPWIDLNDRPRAIRHLNAAISLINRRIANVESVTDETLVVVATIATIEKFHGAHAHWRIHMEGLRKLVELRGGLSCLESRPLIMGKVHRADLCGSVDAVQIPYFSGRYIPVPSKISNTGILSKGFQHLDKLICLDDAMKYCINSLADAMQSMKRLLSNKGDGAEAAKIRFWFTATQYTLLSMDYYSNQPAKEICRLALILFSASLVNERVPRAPICDMLIARLRNLRREQQQCSNPLTAEFILWTMFLAASVASTADLRNYCFFEILHFANATGIYSWEQVVAVLDTFLWDSVLFEIECRKIWDDALALRITQ